MKKFLNSPQTMLQESLDGFAAAHADIVDARRRAQIRAPQDADARQGRADLRRRRGPRAAARRASSASACSTPPAPARSSPRRRPTRCSAAAEAVDQGAGVLFIVKNYEGDVMNFEMAAEMLDGRTPPCWSTTTSRWRHRPIRPAGAASPARWWSRRWSAPPPKQGRGLAELQGARASASTARTRSMGVALTSCTVPAAGKPNFELADNEMEMGVGIHGEPGRRRVRAGAGRRTSSRKCCAAILGDLGAERGRRGAAVRQRLRRHAVDGALSTVMRRGGCSPPPA